MSHLQLVSISEVKTEKVRIDNKVSRQYYTATFANPANPFGKTVSRTFWQQHNIEGTETTWKTANPALVKTFIGKLIPGTIVSSPVEEYDIVNQGTGEVRTASTSGFIFIALRRFKTVAAQFAPSGTSKREPAVPAALIV